MSKPLAGMFQYHHDCGTGSYLSHLHFPPHSNYAGVTDLLPVVGDVAERVIGVEDSAVVRF